MNISGVEIVYVNIKKIFFFKNTIIFNRIERYYCQSAKRTRGKIKKRLLYAIEYKIVDNCQRILSGAKVLLYFHVFFFSTYTCFRITRRGDIITRREADNNENNNNNNNNIVIIISEREKKNYLL